MLGWVFGTGKRDGKITPRLRRLVRILRSAGFNANTSSRMREFLEPHSILPVLIPPIAYRHGLDRSRMIDAQEDLYFLVDAIRESLAILPDVGLRITPLGMKVIMMLPRFILVAGLKSLIASRMGEISFWWDMSTESAPDEIMDLIAEFKTLNHCGPVSPYRV